MFRKIFLIIIILAVTACTPANKIAAEKPFIDLDAGKLAKGTLIKWENNGSMGGSLETVFCGGATVQTAAGRKAVTFNGTSDYLKSTFASPSSITGNNPWSVSIWAYNPRIGGEECLINWARRRTTGRGAQINYGSSRDAGAVTHWSTADMGFDGGVPQAGQWHHIVVTYQGGANGRETVYVDGQVNATENKGLNLWPNEPIYIGCAGGEMMFSGSISSVQIFDFALTSEEVNLLKGKDGQLLKRAIVDLDAEVLPDGPLTQWPNKGSRAGSFQTEASSAVVDDVGGRQAVSFGKNRFLKYSYNLQSVPDANKSFTVIIQSFKPAQTDRVETYLFTGNRQNALRFNYANRRNKTAIESGRLKVGYKDEIPAAGQWHDIAYSYSGLNNELRIYVDGNLNTTQNIPLNFFGNSIYFGSGWDFTRGVAVNPFEGAISKIQVYDHCLSQKQIRQLGGLYNAFNPQPPDNGIERSVKVMLNWEKGADEAGAYKIYFSENKENIEKQNEKAYLGKQNSGDCDYGPVDVRLSQTYYWRVDQLDQNGKSRWPGEVWQFIVETGRAENPIPKDKISAVSADSPVLKWKPGRYAESQSLYFGTVGEQVKKSVTSIASGLSPNVNSFALPDKQLEYGRTYYWRVDTNNGRLGKSIGEIWTFRTEDKYVYNDITFFVASDIHYGASETIGEAIDATIDIMNELPGTRYPESAGGDAVGTPRAVVLCGDLTNDGRSEQWADFVTDFGVNKEGRLAYASYEGVGNHDGDANSPVRKGVIERNRKRKGIKKVSENGPNYSWDWDNVHFVHLNLYTGDKRDKQGKLDGNWNDPSGSLSFLKEDLAENVGDSGRPVILFQHYGWDEGFSVGWGWWSDNERVAMDEAVKKYNIVGIFFGHTHSAEVTEWKGLKIYNDASIQRDPDAGEFLVVHIKDDQMVVAHRFKDRWGFAERRTIKNMQTTK